MQTDNEKIWAPAPWPVSRGEDNVPSLLPLCGRHRGVHGYRGGRPGEDRQRHKEEAGDQWVDGVGAHLVLLVPDPALYDIIPTDPNNGGPWVMWPDAHRLQAGELDWQERRLVAMRNR